jgi:predicted DNA-binding WGR domain protein
MSDPYPMEIWGVSLEHEKGTKAYDIKVVSSSAGPAIVIFRWGKVGVRGDILVKRFDTYTEAKSAAEAKKREKKTRGYDQTSISEAKVVNGRFSLVQAIGRPTLAKLDPDDITHIDPDFDTKGMRRREPPRLDEDGRLNQRALRDKELREKEELRKFREEQRRKEEDEAESFYRNNPLYGAF